MKPDVEVAGPPEEPLAMPWAHPSAIIDEGAEVGAGSKVWHFSHVMGGAKIGKRCSLGQNVFVANTVVIGDGCKIQNNVSLYDGVILEGDVFIGPSAVFTNVVNPRAFIVRRNEYRATLVGQGASIGANATIVCGHNVGAFSFVAAGAVVTKDVPAFALVMGVPARFAGWVCRCGVRLPPPQNDRTACPTCTTNYSVLRQGERPRLALSY